MAEIARLGLEIDAKGVRETRQELEALAKSAAAAAQQFDATAGSMDATGQKVAQVPDGFLAFEQSAKSAAPTIRQTVRGLQEVSQVVREINPELGLVSGNFLQLLTKLTPVGIALGVLGATTAFVVGEFKKAREQIRELAEVELRALSKEAGNLKLEQTIKGQLTVLTSLDPQLESIRQKYVNMANDAEKAGVRGQGLAAIRRAGALEEKKLLDERAQTEAKAFDERLKQFQAEEDALARLRQAKAQDLIQSGRGRVGEFSEQFGVQLPFEAKQAGEDLSNKFATVFNTFKFDRAAEAPLATAFGSLVTQALKAGVPDLPELLSEKLGGANFERLRATIDEPLRAALDATAQSGQQWGDTFAGEFQRFAAESAIVGVRMDEIAGKAATLEAVVSNQLAMSIDVSQPFQAIDAVAAKLAAIAEVTRKTIVIDVVENGIAAGLEQEILRGTGMDPGFRVAN